MPAPRDLTSPLARPLGRRSLLAVGVGAAGLALGGCSAIDPPSSRSGSTPSPTPAAERGLAPDVVLAATALSEIRAVRRAVTATTSRFPAARGALGPVTRMHRTHEAGLVDAVPARARPPHSPAQYVVPARRGPAEQALLGREQQLQALLEGLAVQAESGAFARLLGSMSAGVAQRVVTWPGGGAG